MQSPHQRLFSKPGHSAEGRTKDAAQGRTKKKKETLLSADSPFKGFQTANGDGGEGLERWVTAGPRYHKAHKVAVECKWVAKAAILPALRASVEVMRT